MVMSQTEQVAVDNFSCFSMQSFCVVRTIDGVDEPALENDFVFGMWPGATCNLHLSTTMSW